MINKISIGAIKAYQRVSALFPFRHCRFYPSCSQYAIDAISKYGLFKGTAMFLCRIIRCSPLSKGGHDPVR